MSQPDVRLTIERITMTVKKKLLRTPDSRSPETWYVATDELTKDPIALDQTFMGMMVTIIHYLETKLHGG